MKTNNIIDLNKMNMNELIKVTNNSLMNKRVYSLDKINCAVILLTTKNEVVLGTRIDLPEHVLEQYIKENKEFKWTNASGGLEKGESPLYCAIRELKEEFGIQAGIQTNEMKILNYTDNYYTYEGMIQYRRDFVFIATLKKDVKMSDFTPQDKEIGKIDKFTKNEVMNMIIKNKVYGSTKTSLLMAIKQNYI